MKEISIYFNGNDKLHWEYVIIYDYLSDRYYGTKINKKEIAGKYKIGIIKDIDKNHLSKLEGRILFDKVVYFC